MFFVGSNDTEHNAVTPIFGEIQVFDPYDPINVPLPELRIALPAVFSFHSRIPSSNYSSFYFDDRETEGGALIFGLGRRYHLSRLLDISTGKKLKAAFVLDPSESLNIDFRRQVQVFNGKYKISKITYNPTESDVAAFELMRTSYPTKQDVNFTHGIANTTIIK